jgi:hypothetical protein
MKEEVGDEGADCFALLGSLPGLHVVCCFDAAMAMDVQEIGSVSQSLVSLEI